MRNGGDGTDGGTSHQTSRGARHAEGFALAEERCHPMFTCVVSCSPSFGRSRKEALPGLDAGAAGGLRARVAGHLPFAQPAPVA